MSYTKRNFPAIDVQEFIIKMLNWADQFNIFCFLDNHTYPHDDNSFDCILAADSLQELTLDMPDCYQLLQKKYDEKPCWLFGHLGYNLKEESFLVINKKKDRIGFGKGFFFEPAILIKIKNSQVEINSANKLPEKIFHEINNYTATKISSNKIPAIKSTISKQEYLQAVLQLQQHIKRGDCYEINFCQEFFCEQTRINAMDAYHKLSEVSPNPFAALYKMADKYCLCESPERYLKKTGNHIISQPIKGTAARNKNDALADAENKYQLQNSPKEKSENVMIVDLVRNDLSKVCMEGSVKVSELYGIYSFPQVHQMISTITGILPTDIPFTEIIKATFPMGSMTGAPKQKVVELIDKYETMNRGLFSGSIGYITPEADFDFNVVIRSIFYNQPAACLSFWAGSAITFYSNADSEYEECLLKAAAIQIVLDKL